MKRRIFVLPQGIKANSKSKKVKEFVTFVVKGDEKVYGHEVELMGSSTLVYDPDRHREHGAHVWVETDYPVKVVDLVAGRNEVL